MAVAACHGPYPDTVYHSGSRSITLVHGLSLWFTAYHYGLVAMYPWLVMFS
jgi:hypothetical protein